MGLFIDFGCPLYFRKRFYYRPQQSWGKVMFLHVPVILLTGGVSALPGQTPPGTHPTGMHSCYFFLFLECICQLRIQRRGVRDVHPLSVHFFSFFMQFSAENFAKYVFGPASGVGTPSGNPGSATLDDICSKNLMY